MEKDHAETVSDKIAKLSPSLQQKIVLGDRKFVPSEKTPITNFAVDTMRHCNGGTTVDAGLWLRRHCDGGGKIFLTMAGAGSSFQMGHLIGELMRAGHVAGISVTGANMEESLYRLVAHSSYAYIEKYQELTPEEEKQLDFAGFRRITDTFLPEEESVRVVLPELEQIWKESERTHTRRLWHEHFFEIFERGALKFDPKANPDDCWLREAWRLKIPVFVPGYEDSTMGNIYTQSVYNGNHPFLSKYRLKEPISEEIVHHPVRYMHRMAEFYMDTAPKTPLAFVQLGGGIAADFVICVVPHLKKDYLADQSIEDQEKLIPAWAGFVEIFSSPMSYGSYSGAGYKEKITWGKLQPNSPGYLICGDYTAHFPIIAAIMLGK